MSDMIYVCLHSTDPVYTFYWKQKKISSDLTTFLLNLKLKLSLRLHLHYHASIIPSPVQVQSQHHNNVSLFKYLQTV